jgi:hypothetical protein
VCRLVAGSKILLLLLLRESERLVQTTVYKVLVREVNAMKRLVQGSYE